MAGAGAAAALRRARAAAPRGCWPNRRPGLAGAAQAGKEKTLPQLNQLSLCTTKVLVPTGNQTINDQFSTGGPNYREFLYALTDFAGAAQNFDGNGPSVRAQVGGGPVLVGEPNPKGNARPVRKRPRTNFAHTIADPIGNQPQLGRQAGTASPNIRCFKNPVPDVNGPLGQVGAADAVRGGSEPMSDRPPASRAAGTHFSAWISARPAATATTRSRSSSSPSPAS